MDSLNLSDTQNISINTQNKASNTAPSACAFCGSNDYMKTFSQANCFRTFYPGIPNTKPSESCEDNFTIHQPIFSSPPFLPSFHNSPVPQNVCFGHTNALTPSLNHSSGEKPTDNCLNKAEDKYDGANSECEEKDKNTLVETGLNFPMQHFNPYFQGCFCNSSIPWSCNPFIVPIISYYVLWNSQRAHLNSSSDSTKDENETQSETQNNAVSNCFRPSNLIFNDAKVEKNKQEVSKTEKSKLESEDITKTKPEINVHLNPSETLINESQLRKENNKIEENVKMVEKGAIIPSSVTNCENSSESEIILEKVFNFEGYGISTESKTIIQDCNLNANEESEGSSTDSCGVVKERVPSIKLIKNFTMTDQSKNEHLEESTTSAPACIAAGDLGGENCVGFKVNISDLEEEKKESINNQAEGKMKIKDSKIRGTKSSETETIKHLQMKTPPKAGVAKYSTSSSHSKNGKSENWANMKKDISKKPAITRVKHNCLSQPSKKDITLNNIKNSKSKNHKESGSQKQTIRSKMNK